MREELGKKKKEKYLFIMKESFIPNFIYVIEIPQDHSRYKSLKEFKIF